MSLIEEQFRLEVEDLDQQGVRILHLGRLEGLPASLQQTLRDTVARTERNTALNLVFAINYSGRTELVDAARRLAAAAAAGTLDPQALDERHLAGALYLPEMPDPDLLIRTGGEMRISNYLLWEIAYSEFWSTPVLWPDFRTPHLLAAHRRISTSSTEVRGGFILMLRQRLVSAALGLPMLLVVLWLNWFLRDKVGPSFLPWLQSIKTDDLPLLFMTLVIGGASGWEVSQVVRHRYPAYQQVERGLCGDDFDLHRACDSPGQRRYRAPLAAGQQRGTAHRLVGLYRRGDAAVSGRLERHRAARA